ncbi:MAG: VOC family protein [Candidatus Peribacteraceae bacterium]
MNHPIVHFDIPAKNIKRAQKFYEALFGWHFHKMAFGVDYWSINVLPESKKQTNAGISVQGGMTPRFEESQRMVVYVLVESVDEYIVKTVKLGGKVLVPRTKVPHKGFFSYCEDTEGNMFALWEEAA